LRKYLFAAMGGSGYFRAFGLERILRDAQAVQFHSMPAKKQHHSLAV